MRVEGAQKSNFIPPDPKLGTAVYSTRQSGSNIVNFIHSSPSHHLAHPSTPFTVLSLTVSRDLVNVKGGASMPNMMAADEKSSVPVTSSLPSISEQHRQQRTREQVYSRDTHLFLCPPFPCVPFFSLLLRSSHAAGSLASQRSTGGITHTREQARVLGNHSDPMMLPQLFQSGRV